MLSLLLAVSLTAVHYHAARITRRYRVTGRHANRPQMVPSVIRAIGRAPVRRANHDGRPCLVAVLRHHWSKDVSYV